MFLPQTTGIQSYVQTSHITHLEVTALDPGKSQEAKAVWRDQQPISCLVQQILFALWRLFFKFKIMNNMLFIKYYHLLSANRMVGAVQDIREDPIHV